MTSLKQDLPTPIVDVDWVKENLDHPNLVIVDCRFALSDPDQGRQAYHQGHLPGAFYLDLNRDLSGLVQNHGGRHPLPDISTFVAKLEAMGIASQPATPIVAYDAAKGAFAARLWWLLRYLGHEAISILDGGFPAWQTANYPLTRAVPDLPHNGRFAPHIQSDWIVDYDYVLQHQNEPGTVLVDARSPERYRGEKEPIDPIAGAIPGAQNIFWQSNLDESGRFRNAASLRPQWSAIAASENPIFYCGSGVTACINILAQAILENPLPKLYVGGWSDWCSYLLSESEK